MQHVVDLTFPGTPLAQTMRTVLFIESREGTEDDLIGSLLICIASPASTDETPNQIAHRNAKKG